MQNNDIKNSKIIKSYDFHNIDYTHVIKPFEVDEDRFEKDLFLLRKKHAIMKNVKEIEIGDYVELNCQSNNSRFDKSHITVIVGKGIFNKKLESLLVGLRVNDRKKFIIDDEVDVEILKISRREVPKLDEIEIKKWHIDSINNLDNLRNYLIHQQFNDYLEDTVSEVAMYVEHEAIQKSTFDLSPLDIERNKQKGYDVAIDFMKGNGLDVNHMADDDIWQDLQVTKAQYIHYVENLFVDEFKSSLLGYELMSKDNILPTQDDIEEECKNYYFDCIKEFIKQRLEK